MKVSTQNTLNKHSPPSSETRRISLKLNYGNNLSTNGSSMVNNVDTKESPMNNLLQKEPKSSSALKEPSTTSNCLPKYQNMNGSAVQRVATISRSTPEKLYYNNSPTKSSRKTTNTSTPEKKSYHNISYQDGQLNLDQADINAIKNKWITNITVSDNSLTNDSSLKNYSTPAKAPTANISNFQLFRSFQNSSSFLENSSKKCPTTKNSTPVHEGKQLSIKCYVCKSTFADNPHLKMCLANINCYNDKPYFKCNIC